MVDKATAGSSLYYADREGIEGKDVVLSDGEEQERHVVIVVDGSEWMIYVIE